MDHLHVEAGGSTSARPEVVWALLSDANTYARWGPWRAGGYRPPGEGPSRPGSIQWFRYGRHTTSVEEIVELEAPRRLVYKVVRGLPVKNYRAEVVLAPTTSNGTSVRWAATWDKTIMGRVVQRKLQQIYPEIINALIVAADHEQSSSPPQ